jgi:hypothetical protein
MDQGQDTERTRSRSGSRRSAGEAKTKRRSAAERAGGEAASRIGGAAREAGRQARASATNLASEAGEKLRGLADRQVSAGADLIGHVAESVRSAADSLDESAPELGGFVRGAAERIDDVSETVREKSAGELFQSASDFTRRRPAVVFGAAALLGFLAFRLLRSGSSSEGFDELEDFGDEDEDAWEAGDEDLGREGDLEPSRRAQPGRAEGGQADVS